MYFSYEIENLQMKIDFTYEIETIHLWNIIFICQMACYIFGPACYNGWSGIGTWKPHEETIWNIKCSAQSSFFPRLTRLEG